MLSAINLLILAEGLLPLRFLLVQPILPLIGRRSLFISSIQGWFGFKTAARICISPERGRRGFICVGHLFLKRKGGRYFTLSGRDLADPLIN